MILRRRQQRLTLTEADPQPLLRGRAVAVPIGCRPTLHTRVGASTTDIADLADEAVANANR